MLWVAFTELCMLGEVHPGNAQPCELWTCILAAAGHAVFDFRHHSLQPALVAAKMLQANLSRRRSSVTHRSWQPCMSAWQLRLSSRAHKVVSTSSSSGRTSIYSSQWTPAMDTRGLVQTGQGPVLCRCQPPLLHLPGMQRVVSTCSSVASGIPDVATKARAAQQPVCLGLLLRV